MAETMLSLGGFKFSIDTAAYNELAKTWQWRWQAQPIIGQSDKLQCTGKAANAISLSGQIATTLREVGTQQIETLAKLGDKMEPLLLVSGLGDVLGYWVITNLTGTDSKFLKGGIARRQSFSIELKFYGDDL